jgi:iron-sulfur cluster assembly protein
VVPAVVEQISMQRQVISLTPAAADRVRQILAGQGADAVGIRLGVKPTGCSGFSYKLDFARDVRPGEEVVEAGGGVRVVIDPMAVMYVLGTELDWVEDKLGAQFVFRNPNEKGRCGCGESFSV